MIGFTGLKFTGIKGGGGGGGAPENGFRWILVKIGVKSCLLVFLFLFIYFLLFLRGVAQFLTM